MAEDTKQDAPEKDKKSGMESMLQFVEDIVDRLTFSKLFAVLMLALVATGSALMYENRTVLFEKALTIMHGQKDQANWVLSEQTKTQMVGMVKGSSTIAWILVTEFDLQQNRRIPKYWFFNTQNEAKISERINTAFPQPVFDTDPKNTQQIINVLNNEFVCSPYQDTFFSRIIPDLTKDTPVLCRLSIPPFYGRFVGVVTVGMKRPMTRDEQEQLRIELARFSVEIYLRDIVKKPDAMVIPGHR